MFIDPIIEDKPISPSFYDGLKVQEVKLVKWLNIGARCLGYHITI